MELRDYFTLAWKHRVAVLGVFGACLLSGILFAVVKDARYESTATIVLTPNPSVENSIFSADQLDALLSTYAATAESEVNLSRAARLLGRPLPGDVGTSTEAGSGVLRVTGTAGTPEDAATTARAAAQAFQNSLGEDAALTDELVDPPRPPDQAAQPRAPLIILLATVLGIGLGFLVAYLREHLFRRISTSSDVQHLTSAPVIAQLPRQRALARGQQGLIWESSEFLPLQESFRALRTNVEFLLRGSSTIQVTSPSIGQGKSTIVANLGIALAQIGISTTIVDADLRRPTQHRFFGLDNRVGLSTALVLAGGAIEPQQTEWSNLSVLTSGPLPPDSTSMLHIRLGAALKEQSAPGRVVLVDSPPMLPLSDAWLIASQVEGVILTILAGKQKPSELRLALERLQFAEARLMGIVLNQVGKDGAGLEPYGYGYRPLVLDDASVESESSLGRPRE
jgi:succinoglycan biosynthesis transport protein ExoP